MTDFEYMPSSNHEMLSGNAIVEYELKIRERNRIYSKRYYDENKNRVRAGKNTIRKRLRESQNNSASETLSEEHLKKRHKQEKQRVNQKKYRDRKKQQLILVSSNNI